MFLDSKSCTTEIKGQICKCQKARTCMQKWRPHSPAHPVCPVLQHSGHETHVAAPLRCGPSLTWCYIAIVYLGMQTTRCTFNWTFVHAIIWLAHPTSVCLLGCLLHILQSKVDEFQRGCNKNREEAFILLKLWHRFHFFFPNETEGKCSPTKDKQQSELEY